MKKLLIVTDTFLPRIEGITRFLLNIIPELEKDFELTVLAPAFSGEKSSGNIVRLPCFKFQVADLVPTKFNFMKISHYVKKSDLVFVQSTAPMGAAAILMGFLRRKKVVAYIHVIEWELVSKAISRKFFRLITGPILRLTTRWLYNRCSLLLVPSANIASILNDNNIKTKKAVVHLGTDTRTFSPPKSKAEAKARIDISPDKKVIGYVGRLAREKDLKTLYRAFSRVKRNHPNTVLLIVGDGIEQVKSIFRNKKRVIMTGRMKNVVPYLQAMDIYVLPSLTETTSLSTMEAMSCGLPVVVTPVGYVKDYVVDGYNGYFFQKKNAYMLSKKLEKLLRSEKLRNQLGANARKTIAEHFSWRKTALRIKKVLERV